jgi:hypothetical protein
MNSTDDDAFSFSSSTRRVDVLAGDDAARATAR